MHYVLIIVFTNIAVMLLMSRSASLFQYCYVGLYNY